MTEPVLQSPLSVLQIDQHFGDYLGTYEGIAYEGYHTGTDFFAKPDTPVMAMAQGKVIRVGLLFDMPEEAGWYTVIEHAELGVATLYLHTKTPNVKPGECVETGQVIAEIMDTTRFPAHLHVEVKPLHVDIRKADGTIGLFATATTTPQGNHGYVLSANDLSRFWIDPEALLR